MSEIVLKDAIADRAIEQARLKGYQSPEAYLADLIESDDMGFDEDDDLDDEVIFDEDVKTSFKQALKEVLQGKFYTYEEYKRLLAEDDE
jgi:hypothetical protein